MEFKLEKKTLYTFKLCSLCVVCKLGMIVSVYLGAFCLFKPCTLLCYLEGKMRTVKSRTSHPETRYV